MKLVLVTGATGFTGFNLVKRLSSNGFSIVAPLREGADSKALAALPNVELVKGNITDQAFIHTLFTRDINLIFHIAAAFRKANIPRQTYWDVNYNATQYLLQEAAQHQVEKFIHCSTGGVHGHITNPPANETTLYSPGDIYQQTKCEAEKLVISYLKAGKVKGTIIRPTAIYGPGDRRILKFFKMVEKKRFIMFGKGKVFYHLVYIEDLIDAFLLCMEKEKASGEVFIIGGGEYVTLKELVTLIAQTLNVPAPRIQLPLLPFWMLSALCEFLCQPFKIPPPIYRRRMDIFRKSRAFDISKAQTLLGYQPKMPLKEGLQVTAQWYKEEGLL